MRKRLIKLAACLLIVAVCAALFEGLCTALAWHQFRTLDVQALNDADLGNAFLAEAGQGYAAKLQPHPYLGAVYNSKWPRGNNIGTEGNDFPLVRDPQYFSILFTGGSVACLLARSGQLERAFEKYDFGRPVRILNGAGGGWHQPQQFIMTGLYGEVADAVVTLDGFNEKNRFLGLPRRRLEYDGNRFPELNPLAAGGYDSLGASWECNRLRELSRNHNSRALFYATRYVRQRIESSVEPPAEHANRIWELPADWTPEQCSEFNLAQYRKYIELIDAMSDKLGLRAAHFLQPCPAIGKSLTDEERRVAGDLSYGPVYQRVASEMPVVPLLDVFESTAETVYTDNIHNNELGYHILAERIAAECARLWNVPKRSE